MKSITFNIPEQADYTKTGEEKTTMWNAVNGAWKRTGTTFVDMSLCIKMMNQANGQLKNSLANPFNAVRSSKDERFKQYYEALVSDVTDIADALQSIQRFENGKFIGTLSNFLGYVSGKQVDNATDSSIDNMKNLLTQLTSLLGGKVDSATTGAANAVAAAIKTTDLVKDPLDLNDEELAAAVQRANDILAAASLRTGQKAA